MDSMAIGLRASDFGVKKKKEKADSPAKRAARIALYAERAAANLDIFTGLPRNQYATVVKVVETVSFTVLDNALAEVERQQEWDDE